MNNEFSHYCPLTVATIREIWDEACIVLDANALLNVYRYRKQLRNDYFSLLESEIIRSKLWLPYQVALEFHRNRTKVIAEQKSPYEKSLTIIEKNFSNLIAELSKVDIHKFHPFLDIGLVEKDLTKKKFKVIEKLKKTRDGYPTLISEDPHLDRIHVLFDGCFGAKFDDDEYAEKIKEADERYENRTPPGYKDQGKDGDGKYGDYLLWMQLIEYCKSQNIPAIFVTDDVKEDWWLKINGMTIGPRFELRKEFKDKTGNDILLYNSASFFEYAKEFTGQASSKESIDEILDLLIEKSEFPPIRKRLIKSSSSRKVTIQEMHEWFLANYEDPANGVPYESREGGYQYIFGGPYDPMDVLQDEFPDVEFKLIEEAAHSIYANYGGEWIQKGQY